MAVHMVDVSHHDRDRLGRNLDWQRIITATSPAMVAKLTEGDPAGFSFIDPYGVRAIRDARAAGATAAGGYHCLSHGDEASIRRQVDGFRRQLDAAGAVWGMADVEPFEELVSRDLEPHWADVQRFEDRWHRVEQRTLVWYIPRWYWDKRRPGPDLGSADLRVLAGPLISSHYPGGTGSPSTLYTAGGGNNGPGWSAYGGRTPDLWQYTSQAQIPGASSRTDCSAYRGTAAALVALLTEGADVTPEQLRDADIVPNRAWRPDHKTNPNVRMGFMWWDTWDQAREAAVQAGKARVEIAALAAAFEALASSGGSIDTAAVLARVDQVATEVSALRTELAEAQAERDELRQRLAEALAPEDGE